MSEAHDSEGEQEDEKRREELSTRENVSGAYVSRLIFRQAKQVGKPVRFDWLIAFLRLYKKLVLLIYYRIIYTI